MATIASIREKIVEAMEKGEDTSKLETKLKQARLTEQTKAEVHALQAIADQRLDWQKKAEAIQEEVRQQGEAIDAFLTLRDSITGPLKELLKQAGELPRAQSECYASYHDTFQFGASVKRIPRGILPEGFGCPMLEMSDGKTSAYDKGAEALWYLRAACGCLVNLVKGEIVLPQRDVDEGL